MIIHLIQNKLRYPKCHIRETATSCGRLTQFIDLSNATSHRSGYGVILLHEDGTTRYNTVRGWLNINPANNLPTITCYSYGSGMLSRCTLGIVLCGTCAFQRSRMARHSCSIPFNLMSGAGQYTVPRVARATAKTTSGSNRNRIHSGTTRCSAAARRSISCSPPKSDISCGRKMSTSKHVSRT